MTRKYTIAGGLCLIAYVVQDVFALKWAWLQQMQQDEIYKQISGLTLLLIIFQQWRLFWLRMQNHKAATYALLMRHLFWGVIVLFPFYFHVNNLGYGYLFVLSSVFLVTYALGLLYPPTIGIHSKSLCNLWLIAHVALSCFLILLIGQHIFIAYWYE